MKSLFDPAVLIHNLFIRALPPLAQLFLFRLMALADTEGGYLRRAGAALSLERMAELLGMEEAAALAYAAEIIEMGWLAEDDAGFYIPAMRARSELREKRKRAGAKGGMATTAQRSDVCLSKPEIAVKTETSNEAGKKKKEPKKKNNNIIYIFGQKIDRTTRDTPANPLAFDGKVIKLHQLERKAIAEQLSLDFSEIYDMLDRQDEWLARQDDTRKRAWLPLTLHSLKYQAGLRRAA